MKRAIVALAALTLVSCAGACDFRCHTQHTEVRYHAAYTETGQHCTTVSLNPHREICAPYSTYHPARCSVEIECDMRCKAVDQGAAEAHPDHAPRVTHAPIVDPRCTLGGSVR